MHPLLPRSMLWPQLLTTFQGSAHTAPGDHLPQPPWWSQSLPTQWHYCANLSYSTYHNLILRLHDTSAFPPEFGHPEGSITSVCLCVLSTSHRSSGNGIPTLPTVEWEAHFIPSLFAKLIHLQTRSFAQRMCCRHITCQMCETLGI